VVFYENNSSIGFVVGAVLYALEAIVFVPRRLEKTHEMCRLSMDAIVNNALQTYLQIGGLQSSISTDLIVESKSEKGFGWPYLAATTPPPSPRRKLIQLGGFMIYGRLRNCRTLWFRCSVLTICKNCEGICARVANSTMKSKESDYHRFSGGL